MITKRIVPKLRKRSGFTLIELSFSITFYTMIVVVALAAFLGILGIYSKAQSLTRTQTVSRSVMDSLVRDLRTAQTVRHFALYNSKDTDTNTIPNPVLNNNDAATIANRALARDYWCIISDSTQRGYVNLWNAKAGHYVLVRMSQGCDTLQGYEQIVDNDVWTDATSNINPLAGAAASATDSGALHEDTVTGKDYRGLVIKRIGTSEPAIWRAQVSVYSGKRVPPSSADILDQFSAGTTLQTVVTTRQ